MKTSARNQFSGTVKALTRGPVSTEVVIEVVSGMRIVATISTVSAESLGLAAGNEPASYWDIIKRDNPRKAPARSGPPQMDKPESAG